MSKKFFPLALFFSLSCFATPSVEVLFSTNPSVVKVHVANKKGNHGVGSGVVVAKNYIVTNCHVIANSQAYQQLIGSAGFQSLIQQNPEFGESVIASIMKGLGLETKDYSEQLSALSDTIGAFTDTITLPSVVENKLLTWGNEKTQSIEAQNLAFKQGLETILGREATQGLLWSIKESKPESITALAQIFNMSSVDFSKMVNKTLGNK